MFGLRKLFGRIFRGQSQMSDHEMVKRLVAVQHDPNVYGLNPKGRYPRCQSKVGVTPCVRCGGDPSLNRPCPAIPPERRWGPDHHEP